MTSIICHQSLEWTRTTHLIEDVLQTPLSQGRALHKLDGSQLLSQSFTLLCCDGPLLLSGELLDDSLVIPQIDLRSYDETGDSGAMVVNFWEPFLLDVLKRGGRGDREADEKDIGLRVRKGSQSIVILLTCGSECVGK